ncbi:mRNA export factor GLE1 isoform 2-T2 [Clarias gariepinus]|uniref:mRNA export factor GLE1 isoform X2 n=1 Tax=Clarias gariepinus TaxID=13013 RepID=UPI00234C891C|nr:mRNA export factor GLE1 isoform X2 [Clarias gariepinus]
MPAESLRWETLGALKNSPKAKIKYSPDWLEKGEDILAGCKEVTSLSPLSEEVLKRLSPSFLQKSSSGSDFMIPDASTPENELNCGSAAVKIYHTRLNISSTSPLPLTVEKKVTDNISESLSSTSDICTSSQQPISLFSPKATQMAGCIRICEKKHWNKAKTELNVRQELQECVVAGVASLESEQLKRFEEFMELKQRQEYQSMRDMMEKETQESLGRQEKLKEEHRHRMKILNLRLREAEQQRLREAELERQRQLDGRDRLRALNAVQEEVLRLIQLLKPPPYTQTNPTLDYTSYITRGNQLCSQVSEVVHATTEGQFPTVEDMTVAERALHEMRALVRAIQAELAQEKKKTEQEEHECRTKQTEVKTQQEELDKIARLSDKENTKTQGLQNIADDSTLKWYKELQTLASHCAHSFEDLNSKKDIQTKKMRMELQKAATIPVSQISSISGSQLKEIFDKIDKLLLGRQVVSGGKSVSTLQHPRGLEFVSYKLAEKFVKQGEEEVASHHEAAFPIAVVASGVWELHPKVGELILAHLHKKCPYAVPYYPPMKDSMSIEEYQQILGYRVDESGVEGQDSFLKRMSGMIRLYAAIIQLRWPYINKQGPGPHGLNHGWRWLAQMLNMEPLADVTATLLFDFLEVCGNALMKQYQGQFWKLLLLIKEEYFPRIEAVTNRGQMGSVMRLKQFLEVRTP